MAAGSDDIIDFWFGAAGSPEHGQSRKCWFVKDAAFDAEIRWRFLSEWEDAAAGGREDWRAAPRSALALVVTLDQFPRNMFRGEARAFSSDARALSAAMHMIAQGYDRDLPALQRWFAYLPFEHAEELAMQERSLALFEALAGDTGSAGTIDYARRHYDIIARFGRFPHRNAILGRASTPEEVAFLQQPGSSF